MMAKIGKVPRAQRHRRKGIDLIDISIPSGPIWELNRLQRFPSPRLGRCWGRPRVIEEVR